jgi:hypothetical protein
VVGVERELAESRNRLSLLAEPLRMACKIKKNQTQRCTEKLRNSLREAVTAQFKLPHFEIVGDKRISQHLSGPRRCVRQRLAVHQNLRSAYLQTFDLSPL